MEVQFLASAPESPGDRLYASSYLINRTVAIDAGCLGYCGGPEDQTRVRHIFLTHSHADHTASLPIMVENAFDPTMPAVTVHGLPGPLDAVRKHIFNDIIWPDFIRLSHPERPFLLTAEVTPEQPIEVEGLRLLPVMVEHVVPTVAYIVTDGRSTVIFGGDSGPTTRLWELTHQIPAPRSVFLECSFPNSMTWLAEVSKHLTPEMFGVEVRKMPPMDKVIAVHLKRRFKETMIAELEGLGVRGLTIGEGGATYQL